jgi:hypothetical protein
MAVFRHWLQEAAADGTNSSRAKRLDIRMASLVPVSFDIVDAELPTGLLICRHTLPNAPQSHTRPAFALRGGVSNPVFRTYVEALNEAFARATPLKPA